MANTNTPTPSSLLEQALTGIPKRFRDRLLKAYTELKRNCIESRYDAAGISAGKFCEVCLRFLQERVLGSFTPFGAKIVNFADECRKIVTTPTTAVTDAEKSILPRALVLLESTKFQAAAFLTLTRLRVSGVMFR